VVYRRTGKRLLDVGVSSIGLIVLSPLLAAVSIWLRIVQGSPVIFRQERTGLDERSFTMVKFRTMRDPEPGAGEGPDSERLTGLGIFLRKTSLDELPELWNVLHGDMSVVGPRPLPLKYTPYFTAEERRRFSVRPGITGLAQVGGRNNLSWTERFAMDIEYANTVSLRQDIKVLMRTFGVALRRSGLHADPGAMMDDLDVERAGMDTAAQVDPYAT
jgi:lipopolysaccharide/colanic/teichoic acid biosynthesis glycosyltransferase